MCSFFDRAWIFILIKLWSDPFHLIMGWMCEVPECSLSEDQVYKISPLHLPSVISNTSMVNTEYAYSLASDICSTPRNFLLIGTILNQIFYSSNFNHIQYLWVNMFHFPISILVKIVHFRKISINRISNLLKVIMAATTVSFVMTVVG